MKIKYSQVVKDLESAKQFCSVNKIEPTEVIILWEEDED
jgi:hypothetical protein